MSGAMGGTVGGCKRADVRSRGTVESKWVGGWEDGCVRECSEVGWGGRMDGVF